MAVVPLLYRLGGELLRAWGPARTAQIMPVREWLAAGALVAAGSDAASATNPLHTVWGMITRGTRDAGVQGIEHAVDRFTALRLHTAAAAELNGEPQLYGTIQPGHLADLVAYADDSLTIDADGLPKMTPVFTMVGSHAVHDPDGRLR
jgi:predicted amidohydrolase YtcJ